jgi:hypothetical protein|tara:strand:- start:88 stop:321 length:234 start_codon:yes stop_codon:yes gene_type:complete
MNSIFSDIQKEMDEFFDHIDSILDRDPDEVDVITDHLPEPEKCCTICEFSEPGDGCGANDLSESEFWEMKAELHFEK